MQLPASPADPTASRTRPFHWVTTALALAAITAVAALVEPSGATARPGGQDAAGPVDGAAPEPGAPVAGPDPEGAAYPLDCGPLDVLVTDSAQTDLDGDGRRETLAVVRCDAGSGTPPNGMYLLTLPATDGAPATVAATLVDPAERMTVERLEAEGGTVSVRLLGYSSDEVPRCCPDLVRDVDWLWEDGRLALRPQPAPNSV
ncbi:hypothetical protein [Streptomyces avicenniae]|uniref:hypothetical protein n=1 Tax=Streptomyces avicenniae TaxID=500153 RepID=UPI00069C0F97|nr:hypothetical protein [Streptomyces avicenniae]